MFNLLRIPSMMRAKINYYFVFHQWTIYKEVEAHCQTWVRIGIKIWQLSWADSKISKVKKSFQNRMNIKNQTCCRLRNNQCYHPRLILNFSSSIWSHTSDHQLKFSILISHAPYKWVIQFKIFVGSKLWHPIPKVDSCQWGKVGKHFLSRQLTNNQKDHYTQQANFHKVNLKWTWCQM